MRRKSRTTTGEEYRRVVDLISTREYQFTKEAVAALQEVGLCAGLTSQLQTDSDYSNHDKWPLLFEARFAYELLRLNVAFAYEYPTGVGGDSVDFKFETEHEWLVELVSPQTSVSAIEQTAVSRQNWGAIFAQTPDQGVEATRIVGKIIEKASDKNGNPKKFPQPVGRSVHMIVVDMRRYLTGSGGDMYDWREIAHGAVALPRDFPFHTLAPGTNTPMKGAFEPDHPYPRARHLRERVHFISFVAEKKFEAGEIPSRLYTEPNPNIFPNTGTAFAFFQGFPLRKPENQA